MHERERKSSEKYWERKNLLQCWRAELLTTSPRQNRLLAGGGEAATPDTVSFIGLADCACTECEIKIHMFLFLMTLFHNQVLGCIFFFVVNLWLMKVSRLTAEETHFINNTQQPVQTVLSITINSKPSGCTSSIALLWNRCEMRPPQYCLCKA